MTQVIKLSMQNIIHLEIKIPNKDDWIITLWHLSRDSYEEYSGEKFQCSWKVAKESFYSYL